MRLRAYLLSAFAALNVLISSATAREMTRAEICALIESDNDDWPNLSQVDTMMELADHNANSEGMMEVVERQKCALGPDDANLIYVFGAIRALKQQGYNTQQVHMRLREYLPDFVRFTTLMSKQQPPSRHMTRAEICGLVESDNNDWPNLSQVGTMMELAAHNAHSQGMMEVVERQKCALGSEDAFALRYMFDTVRALRANGYNTQQVHNEFYKARVRAGL